MTENLTPIRQQYLRIKRQYPQVILFFRLGDFYETFDEDARVCARELEIVLTSRSMGKDHVIPMAGIPYHALDNYLSRLINRGYKVAICEQITKPGQTRGIVAREVVRLVTPGTVVEPNLLNSKVNNYLVSLVIEGDQAAVAYADITTGEFAVTQAVISRISGEIERLKPSEILVAKSLEIQSLRLTAPVTRLEDNDYDMEKNIRRLKDHFGVASLEGYGCENLPLATSAAGSIIGYLNETQKSSLLQLTGLNTYSTGSFMALDFQTQNNLDLFQSSRSGKTGGSLLSVLDLTRTAMGGRMLRKWIGQPLLDLPALDQRLDAVEWFFQNSVTRLRAIGLLSDMADMERLINRIKGRIASPREVAAMKRGLEILPEMKDLLQTCPLQWLSAEIKPHPDLIELIRLSLVENPPASLDEGGVIKPGFSPELDELRSTSGTARQYLADLEQKERVRTGIKNLKVGYNRIFGYYIEISNSSLPQVPAEYIRKQTLVNGERFFTPELKDFESQILNAQERIVELETDLFQRVCLQIGASSEAILVQTRTLAEIDVFSSLAETAVRHDYIRPRLNKGQTVLIRDGRHPVVEQYLPEHSFIPNDTLLSNDDVQMVILTGPNMAGKSTYLRQVALIVLMAQIGSFVPAASAEIGLVDRIFTRIGAGEDLAAGKSTFMVEMTETAIILNNATPDSLIILDEIGRGTSTYDGL
ncbi:MAG TPA: DNA mismatch repair protein MutS, partial [Dehalococcoidales bacterium]|nr:DNA mismatch repair protein MutS [Dehalococcoidales bacterium]